MDFVICYLEVFDEETTLWNYQCKSDNPEPINCWYNNLESFFDGFDVSFLFKELNNQVLSNAVATCKGLPIDCSEQIAKAHYFYFEEVQMCHSASYLNLTDLCHFDYEKSFDSAAIAEKDIILCQFDLDKNKQQFIPHKEWL
ncbi:MAG: hypothetical protein CFE24_15210 [Flavobacterium sp. BFFFF2]|nr:MAG: hypothetical protein CFE24_15210 [Flavobacterium sp. BFFFF2]